MDTVALVDLSKNSSATLAELAETSPEAAKLAGSHAADSLSKAVKILFSEGSEELRAALVQIDFERDDLASDAKIGQLALAKLRRLNVSAGVLDEADKIARGQPPRKPPARPPARRQPERVRDVIDVARPVGLQPALTKLNRLAASARSGKALGVSDRALAALSERHIELGDLDRGKIIELAKSGVIGRRDSKTLESAASVTRLVDRNPALIEALAQDGAALRSSADLLGVSAKTFTQVVQASKAHEALGLDAKAYGQLLRERVEASHPGAAMSRRLKPKQRAFQDSVRALAPLVQASGGAKVFSSRSLDQLDLSEFSAPERRRLAKAHADFRALASKYPGMGIAELLDSGTGTLDQRAAGAYRLARNATEFMSNNAGFLAMDLSAGSADLDDLDYGSASAEVQASLLDFAKSYQRLQTVACSAELTEKVAAAGYNSALSIAHGGLDSLLESSTLTAEEAEVVYYNAMSMAPGVVGYAGSVIDLYRDWFDGVSVGNTPVGADRVLKELPGFEDFFGSQDYCDCEHCRSILGPAAYFVDLMSFIEERISGPTFSPSNRDHPLFLGKRRPDLWTLPLTCENTNELIPTLQIVTEILETYIAKDNGFSGDLTDRGVVESFVYHDTLPGAVHSFLQPVVLPLDEIAIYLEHYSITLRDIVELTQGDQTTRARLLIGLAMEPFTEIITVRTSLSVLRRVYGVTFQESGSTIQSFEAKELLSRTGLDRDELGRAVQTRFVTRDGTDNIIIVGAKRSSDSVQNDMETVSGLTRIALDRLRRMTLLCRALGWSHDELDVALEYLEDIGLGSALNASLIEVLGRLDEIRSSYKLTVDESVALIAEMPQRATTEDGDSLVDRAFNQPPYDALTPWPDASTAFLLPAFAPDESSVDANLERLQNGLRLDDEGLTQLVTGLATALGADPEAVSGASPDLAARSFDLTHANLSRLHRHAAMARMLSVTPTELMDLIALAPAIAGTEVSTLDEVRALIDFHDWFAGGHWSIDDLNFITRRPVSEPALYPDSTTLAQTFVDGVTEDEVLVFSSSVFTVIEGISDATSAAIISANPTAIDASGEGYGLTASYTPGAALVLPPDDLAAGIELSAAIRADQSPLHDALSERHTGTLITNRLPSLLSARVEAIEPILDLLGVNLSDASFVRALRGDDAPGAIDTLLNDVAPLATLFEDDTLDADRLAFIGAEAVNLFALSDPRAITVDAAVRVAAYADLGDALDALDSPPDLHAVLQAFSTATLYENADQTELAAVLDCEVALSQALQDALALETEAFTAMTRLQDGVAVARRLSVSGQALARMTSSAFDDLAAASSALQAGFHAKYVSEDEFEEKIEPYRDRVYSRRRDGLAYFLVYSSAPGVETIEDLYYYFLIDVQLEGCARTSRVVSANSTLQLYVQRVMLNLEETPAGHADPIHVSPDLVDKQEWSWRKNYRVWEANRRVFLYPENYLLPELRDNMTPLFESVQESLLSQDINDESVRDVYTEYLRGFEEVSRLQISGAYHEKDEDTKTDVLHLFGVTADEPPVHYYRRIENLRYGQTEPGLAVNWGAWREIEAKIPARKVSPIIHLGRLYIFWVEVSTTTRQNIEDGTTEFAGYNHKFKMYFATRKLDGSWTTAQAVKMERDPFRFGDGLVIDMEFGSSVLYSSETHLEPKDGYTLRGFAWDRVFPSHLDADASDLVIRGFDYQLNAQLDLYQLAMGQTITSEVEDVRVPWVDPLTALLIILFGGKWGFPSSRILWSELSGAQRILHRGSPGLPFCDNYAFGSLVISREGYESVSNNRMGINYMMHGPGATEYSDDWGGTLTDLIEDVFDGPRLITFDEAQPELAVIAGSENHGVIDVEGALFLLMDGLRADDKYQLQRLNSTLASDIARTLFTRGVDEMLDIETQEALAEHGLPFNIANSEVADETRTGEVDYEGPMGVYLREIYFHMPALIATQLNAQGDYKGAQEWFHYIFDPTANEVITDIGPSLSDEDKKRRKLDRNWRYREFRNREATSLRDILENETAIETYKSDPFNPHTIARLRLTSYQKWVVLAYVSNLLDWADALFSTDMREQINEATLLYLTALDILGPRPMKLGDCGERIEQGSGLTYADLEDELSSDSELLLEIETFHVSRYVKAANHLTVGTVAAEWFLDATRMAANAMKAKGVHVATGADKPHTVALGRVRNVANVLAEPEAAMKAVGIERAANEGDALLAYALRTAERDTVAGPWQKDASISARRQTHRRAATGASPGRNIVDKNRYVAKYGIRETLGISGAYGGVAWISGFGTSLTRQVHPVFCVPENDELDKYWDRVEDRLFKIRNCMNIDGVRRPLALFAPRIDPLMLIRAQAAGLSLDEVIGIGAGELPPFRFRYLVERARAAATMTQSFGAALLNALANKDGEELAQLRNTHQANILKMSEDLKEYQIDLAEQGIEQLEKRRAMVTERLNHYAALLSEGNTEAENVRTVSKVVGAALKTGGAVMDVLAAVNSLIPQVGAPTAMKWGGDELGHCFSNISKALKGSGAVADNVAAVAGIIADYERRAQGWAHHIAMAEKELETLEPQEESAQTRLDIAKRSLKLHQLTMSQHDEIIDFYKDKFTALGLYSYLASAMQLLYRQAYNIALGYARLAEVAYRFETNDDSFLITGDYWTASRAGLLAGEKLTLDLATLEKRYIEGRRRDLEVNQSLSLAQVDPAALLQLKSTGTCSFTIPEFAFDLMYPGQYKRRIKSLRLTIPCIAGPYTNISATLSMTESFIRGEPDATLALRAAPRPRDTMIATSTAQADAGVFELNFRDERYLPFEGGGAISAWQLDLPGNFRPFDYDSITDVILNISYTADYSATLRADVEASSAAITGAIANYLSTTPQTRIFSLRQEFSAAYQRLLGGAVGSAVDFEITDRHFPLYLLGRTPSVATTTLLISTADGTVAPGALFRLNSRDASGFVVDANYGDALAATVSNAFSGGLFASHTISVVAPDALAPASGTAALDGEVIKDILIAVDYTVT